MRRLPYSRRPSASVLAMAPRGQTRRVRATGIRSPDFAELAFGIREEHSPRHASFSRRRRSQRSVDIGPHLQPPRDLRFSYYDLEVPTDTSRGRIREEDGM